MKIAENLVSLVMLCAGFAATLAPKVPTNPVSLEAAQPRIGSDDLAAPALTKIADPPAVHEVQAASGTSELDLLRRQVAEKDRLLADKDQTIAALEAEVKQLHQRATLVSSQRLVQQPKLYPQPPSGFSSCGPGGCGPARGRFGRRR